MIIATILSCSCLPCRFKRQQNYSKSEPTSTFYLQKNKTIVQHKSKIVLGNILVLSNEIGFKS